MTFDSTDDLRVWAANIEKALGIALHGDGSGAFVLRTKAGALIATEPSTTSRAVIMTGEIGKVDHTTTGRRLGAAGIEYGDGSDGRRLGRFVAQWQPAATASGVGTRRGHMG